MMKKSRRWIFVVSLFCGASALLIGSALLSVKASMEQSLPIVSVEAASATSLLPALTQSSSPSAVPVSSSLTGTLTPTNAPTVTPTPSPSPTWYDGYADPRTITAETVTNPEDLTVL